MNATFWISLGVVLAVSEFFVPGFVIIFFGAGAVATGIVKALVPGLPDAAAVFIFAAASLVSMLAFRKTWVGGKVLHSDGEGQAGDMDETCIGRKVSVVAEIRQGHAGKVELNGANWAAECETGIAAGESAIVVARNGLTLVVKPA